MCNVRLIVFCDWPSSQWLVEALLLVLGFNVRSIRAKHKSKDREESVRKFNDETNPVQVLVTSQRIPATGLNLQACCADMFFIVTPSNTQTALQAAGRIIRIGQHLGCSIYIIVTGHSYD